MDIMTKNSEVHTGDKNEKNDKKSEVHEGDKIEKMA